ncbi:hypothetical protein T440DRAFT_234177 [Plenodomus tracheiphilus IPT5]|uniref:Uncharacterized protein n=1 Tax=Plenodomus tracheiphilus IPT5 TaxID=1408161 RepID=A0A6A7BJ26_9PLEO|nr:hypothetical protein T440DRAFT_234177 [Plenodomus tracheiphilus IPT5]
MSMGMFVLSYLCFDGFGVFSRRLSGLSLYRYIPGNVYSAPLCSLCRTFCSNFHSPTLRRYPHLYHFLDMSRCLCLNRAFVNWISSLLFCAAPHSKHDPPCINLTPMADRVFSLLSFGAILFLLGPCIAFRGLSSSLLVSPTPSFPQANADGGSCILVFSEPYLAFLFCCSHQPQHLFGPTLMAVRVFPTFIQSLHHYCHPCTLVFLLPTLHQPRSKVIAHGGSSMLCYRSVSLFFLFIIPYPISSTPTALRIQDQRCRWQFSSFVNHIPLRVHVLATTSSKLLFYDFVLQYVVLWPSGLTFVAPSVTNVLTSHVLSVLSAPFCDFWSLSIIE